MAIADPVSATCFRSDSAALTCNAMGVLYTTLRFYCGQPILKAGLPKFRSCTMLQVTSILICYSTYTTILMNCRRSEKHTMPTRFESAEIVLLAIAESVYAPHWVPSESSNLANAMALKPRSPVTEPSSSNLLTNLSACVYNKDLSAVKAWTVKAANRGRS